MNNSEKEAENKNVCDAYNIFLANFCPVDARRFLNYKAILLIDHDYIALKSYDTIVCFYERSTGKFYDILRLVYSRSTTSSRHISKFIETISNEYKYCGALSFKVYRYRP